jgi:hypothetical protein
MQRSKISFLVRIAALSVLASAPALASESCPAAIQEAASMPCAPSCTLCHGVDPGTADTYTKKELGKNLFNYKGSFVLAGDTDALKKNFAAYAMDPANAAIVAALKAGIDPQTNVDLCSASNNVTYGCGAHIARTAPPRDFSGLVWVIGAVAGGGLLRRRKATPR